MERRTRRKENYWKIRRLTAEKRKDEEKGKERRRRNI